MLNYPVDIKQTSSETFRAVWVDFPDLPQGQGKDARAAFEALIDNSFAIISDLVARNLHPTPSAGEGRPVVRFSPPGQIVPTHVNRLMSVTRNGTYMATFGWTNDFTYVE